MTIPERPGAFRDFCAVIGRRVITEFNYRLSSRDQARIFVGVSTRSKADARELADRLTAEGYRTIDLSDNEVAKVGCTRWTTAGHLHMAKDDQLGRTVPVGADARRTYATNGSAGSSFPSARAP